jgi:transketolase
MKATFFNHAAQQAAIDPNLYLVIGDLGFPFAQTFQQKFPERFINAGIAEQNMIGVAAGLAMAGKKVYVYSIIPFLTMRCFEQIRNDLCYQQLPVTLVGAGGGLVYGAQGTTHHAIEDIAIMRSLPNMTVTAPGNTYELTALLRQVGKLTGPSYVRLSNAEESMPTTTYDVTCGVASDLIPHHERYIITTGNALDLGYQTHHILMSYGIECGLASMHTIKPLDHAFFDKKHVHAVFTIEEHSIIGGLGQAVAHVLCEHNHHPIFHAFGIPDCYAHESGSREELKKSYGLTPQNIATTIMQRLGMYQPHLPYHHHEHAHE